MMQHSLSKSFGIALLSLGLSSSLFAQKVWNKNSEKWETSANWTGGTPAGTTGANQAQFLIDSTSNAAAITVTIGENVAAKTNFIDVGLGKDVTLQMEDGSSLTTGALWGIGTGIGSGSGSAHLTIKGPTTGSATVTSGYFFVGRSDSSGGSNTLTFSGANLVVNDTGTSTSTVGRFTNNNTLFVEAGAVLNRYSLTLSPANADAGRIGNGAVVTGDESKLSLNGGSLLIGYTAGSRQNYVEVSDNGTLEINASKGALIGISTGFGGNYLEVSTGGKIKASGPTTIAGHAENGGNNSGANRLSILAGGSYSSSSTIANSGLLQLADGGVLKGETVAGVPAALAVTIASGGRFEVEGSGLAANVSTTVDAGGTFAIGLTDELGERQGPALLTLSSTVDFKTNSILEIAIFGSDPSEIDQIIFTAGSILKLNGTVTLKLVFEDGFGPQIGDKWTLFGGLTENIDGQFVFGDLDTDLWDISRFNEEGNWEISVIPEPATGVALAFGSALVGLQLTLRRRKAARLPQ